jgi:hypothetical protein
MPATERTTVAPTSAARPVPLATLRAYRRTGGAIVIVERARHAPHRHRISLRRYAALREWTITRAARRWRTSGYSDRSSFVLTLWSAA